MVIAAATRKRRRRRRTPRLLTIAGACPEEEEEDDYADDAGSQVTFDTSSIAGTDFLTPGGLNSFAVALPAKSEKLLLKDLPKIIKASGISKKNYSVTIDALNVGIGQLRKTAIAENSTARST